MTCLVFNIVHDWTLQGFRVLCRVNLQVPGCSVWWQGGMWAMLLLMWQLAWFFKGFLDLGGSLGLGRVWYHKKESLHSLHICFLDEASFFLLVINGLARSLCSCTSTESIVVFWWSAIMNSCFKRFWLPIETILLLFLFRRCCDLVVATFLCSHSCNDFC